MEIQICKAITCPKSPLHLLFFCPYVACLHGETINIKLEGFTIGKDKDSVWVIDNDINSYVEMGLTEMIEIVLVHETLHLIIDEEIGIDASYLLDNIKVDEYI